VRRNEERENFPVFYRYNTITCISDLCSPNSAAGSVEALRSLHLPCISACEMKLTKA